MPIDATFGGKIHWDISVQSWDTDSEALKLEQAIKGTVAIEPKEEAMLSEFCVLLSCTREVAFSVNGEKPVLAWYQFREMITQQESPAELWAARKALHYGILGAWRAAFSDKQQLFVIDPAQLPEGDLTPSQKEELKDKNSPLAVTAANSESS